VDASCLSIGWAPYPGIIEEILQSLEQVKCNIFGVVLNGMRPEVSPDFQDFKYYRYYYHGEEKKGRSRWGFRKRPSSQEGRAGEQKPEAWATLSGAVGEEVRTKAEKAEPSDPVSHPFGLDLSDPWNPVAERGAGPGLLFDRAKPVKKEAPKSPSCRLPPVT